MSSLKPNRIKGPPKIPTRRPRRPTSEMVLGLGGLGFRGFRVWGKTLVFLKEEHEKISILYTVGLLFHCASLVELIP